MKSGLKMRAAGSVLLACLAASGSARGQNQSADVLIKGGTIYDGTEGNKGFIGDVAVSGDKIVYVGPKANVTAKRTIDAKGMIVSPGFIDGHSHGDRSFLDQSDPQKRQASAWIMQGVSTMVLGVDGAGPPEIKDLFDKYRQQGIGTNVVSFVGYAPIRHRVIGDDDRAPTAAELATEKELVAKGMCEGAVGFSTGLFYTPQFFAKTDEIIELAKEAAKRGGIYDTHERDEGGYSVGLMASTKEALQIGREAGLPVHFAHMKALGPDVWGDAPQVVKLVDQARAAGQIVTADQYPYPSGQTSLQAVVIPPWALDGGYPALIKRFNDPATMARIETDTTATIKRMGAHNILFTKYDQPWTGKNLEEMAKVWKVTPFEAAVRILRQSDRQSMVIFGMRDDDMQYFMKQPWTMTSSDGGDGHPREYGTFPTKYTEYVKKKHTLSLAAFIHQSTGLPAEIYSLDHRGTLKPGNYADVLVFDPGRFAAKSDYVHWDVLSEGVVDLLVNGKLAVDTGKMTDVLSGRPLPHTPTQGSCL